MHARYYKFLREELLLSAISEALGEIWTFQHDNGPVSSAVHTKLCFRAIEKHFLDWPSCTPELHFIDSIWEDVARDVYNETWTYENKEQIVDSVHDCFINLVL